MKKILAICCVAMLLSTSCQSLQNWLFNASDYKLIGSKAEETEGTDEESIFWDDADFDIWFDENEYE